MCVTELLQFGNECIVYRHVVLNHPNLTEILFEAKQFPSQLEVVLLSRISEYREFESHPMTSNRHQGRSQNQSKIIATLHSKLPMFGGFVYDLNDVIFVPLEIHESI